MQTPDTAIDVYKTIIDELVRGGTEGGWAPRVAREEYFFEPTSSAAVHNEFLRSLDSGQRLRFAQMLREERESAIHDTLATLTWWIDCRDVRLTFRGQPMPTSLSGVGLHGDYVGRRDGWQWPG